MNEGMNTKEKEEDEVDRERKKCCSPGVGMPRPKHRENNGMIFSQKCYWG